MSSEATVRVSLNITKDSFSHQTQPTGFNADVAVGFGPSPGALTVSVSGTDVDLSALAAPGLCFVQNLDAANPVTLGRWDPSAGAGGRFYPFMTLLPGECYVFRLADDVTEEYEGTGTGTSAAATTLRLKAKGAPCKVRFDAFDS